MPLTYGLDDVRGVASFFLSSSFQSNSINYNISIGQIFNVMTQKKSAYCVCMPAPYWIHKQLDLKVN